jgi:hypothetical protein
MVEREFSKTYSNPPYTEVTRGENSTFRHEITSSLNYTLRQRITHRERGSEETPLKDTSLTLSVGGDVEKTFLMHWKVRPGIDYSYTRGKEAGNSEVVWYSVYPKIWLERNLLRGGRIYSAYGINILQSPREIDLLYRENGFRKGITHQLQAGMDIQMGKYIYGNGNYLLRYEHTDDKLLQKLTLELRALF